MSNSLITKVGSDSSLGLINENTLCKTQSLTISNGVIESLKWLALIAMTCSHVNYVLFDKDLLPFLTEFGCIAFPLFGFVLAYNLARPESRQGGMHVRAMQRMFIFGLLATPVYIAALPKFVKRWLPLNMMFTLMLAAGVIWLLEDKGRINLLLAFIVFIFAGAFVSGSWFCIGYCLAAWYLCKNPSIVSFAIWLASIASLGVVYPSYWGLFVVPIIFLAMKIDFKVPRVRLVFYAYYPVHFAALMAIKMVMTKAVV